MKNILISILRDKTTSILDYRHATERLAEILAIECANQLKQEEFPIQTPLAGATGYKFKNRIILISIIRSGLTLLPAFLRIFESAKVGFIGLERDEHTAISGKYYQKIPPIDPTDEVIVLEPMIATGGSGVAALQALHDLGAREEKINFISVIAAPEGIQNIHQHFPLVKIMVAEIDEKLNANKYIVPGLGDFGDRYFGTV